MGKKGQIWSYLTYIVHISSMKFFHFSAQDFAFSNPKLGVPPSYTKIRLLLRPCILMRNYPPEARWTARPQTWDHPLAAARG